MPKALHKNKWRKISDIEKCEDGFKYQLEGIEGKVYAKDIDDLKMSKAEMHEITNPDGSITRGPGKEPLMKPMKKSIHERWALIKAMISHEQAFMPMEDQEQDQEPQQDQDQPMQSSIQDPDAEDKSDAVDISQLGEQDGLVSGGDNDDGQQLQDDSAQDGAGVAQDSGGSEVDQEADSTPIGEEELIQLLEQEGYSPAEIAHIVHGHTPVQDPTAQQMDLEQAREQEKHDHKMDHSRSESDIKLDHTKRMADLEHEHAKREKELRLKYLEEELKTKVENLKNKSKGE